jgi:hypothetical protein
MKPPNIYAWEAHSVTLLRSPVEKSRRARQVGRVLRESINPPRTIRANVHTILSKGQLSR